MPTIKTGIRFSKKQPLSEQELRQLHAYWRAANYLTACQLYLMDNPLLERPLVKSDLKQTIVGHWGTCPGQNFIYTHLDRVIKRNDLDMIYLSGPGHGGNAMVAQDWLDGSYTEVYPNITRDKEGMQKLFKRFSFPGGIPSHVAPETPGSIHEGGELGYSLAHAFGAVADNPDLIAACVVGDGEAETGPLATSWHGNKFVNPITDGAVLPILHLNGFKIANPTIFSRMSHEEVECFFRGCGWEPYFVEGDDPMVMHQQMAAALDRVIREIKRIQREARKTGEAKRPRWPMIVLRTPKGWTGPKEVDGLPVENCWRAHQVPISMGTDTDRHLAQLEAWLRSYKPEELFNPDGTPVELIASFPPTGRRRMGANPHANGGLLLRDLRTPDFRDYAVDVKAPGAVEAQDMYVLGIGDYRDSEHADAGVVGHDHLRHCRHTHRIATDDTEILIFGRCLERRAGSTDVDTMHQTDAILTGDVIGHTDQPFGIGLCHCRETRPPFFVILTSQRILGEKVDVVRDDHHVAYAEFFVHSSRGVAYEERTHT